MRVKNEIDIVAAIFPKRNGAQTARELGFTPGEYNLLWWLAEHPDHALTKFDEDRKTKTLEAISRQPKQAAQLILHIRGKKRTQDNAIRAVLLDRKANPPNWTLQNKEVAHILNQKLYGGRLRGEAFVQLTGNVKKQRQGLAKKFPLAKGKT